MPFALFRKHQRKLLAIFAILAMFGFVMADSLPALLGPRGGSGPGGRNPLIAKIDGKMIYASDLEPMRAQRQRANYFVSQAFQQIAGPNPAFAQIFGGISTQELIDAVILEREADAMGIPATAEMANQWLRQKTQKSVNARFFQDIYRRSSLSNQVTDTQLLAEIANQIRIMNVRNLPTTAEATPLDVFDAYRDQNEKVSAFAVPVRVEEFVSKVGEPSANEIRAIYEAGKDRLPDSASPLPGFLVPQKVRYEIVTADVPTRTEAIRPSLTVEEMREYYDARPEEFLLPPTELPTALFANAPDLTKHDAFPEIRDQVSIRLAEEKARDAINSEFDAIKNDTMRAFEDTYYEAGEDKDDDATVARPEPGDLLKTAATKAGLTFESTPLVPSTDLAGFGPIRESHLGTTARASTSPAFASLAFAPKTTLYDPIELTDAAERRYLAWKVLDEPARVPSLEQVRAEVVRAWKLSKARPLAEAEARAIADAARKDGGGDKIRAAAGSRPVLITEPRAEVTPALMTGGMVFGEARPTEILELPLAGERLRGALFHLEPTTTAVAPNEPEDVYYALSLRDRDPVEMATLYEFGSGIFLFREVDQEASRVRIMEWMKHLRSKAGLPADWRPPVEARAGDDDLADAG